MNNTDQLLNQITSEVHDGNHAGAIKILLDLDGTQVARIRSVLGKLYAYTCMTPYELRGELGKHERNSG